jgi:hypothetical protein
MDDPQKLRGKSLEALTTWMKGFNENTSQYLLGKYELERRARQPALTRANISIAISIVATIISSIALFGDR